MLIKIGIDPGHGGSDPGAVNGKYLEKDITLAVSKELQTLAIADGFEVIMTREDDIDVSYSNSSASEELGARVDVMNVNAVDICISIHCNAAASHAAQGTETFHTPGAIHSSRLAKYVHEELTALGLVDRGVKTANFMVLKYTDMPAVLVELAFISNDEDLQVLLNRQVDMAQAIYAGVKNWLNSYN